jgi:hypothetical protein
MSRERLFEISAEIRNLIEEQTTLLRTGSPFLEMSAEAIAECVERHARIGRLHNELKTLSYLTEQKAESIN